MGYFLRPCRRVLAASDSRFSGVRGFRRSFPALLSSSLLGFDHPHAVPKKEARACGEQVRGE
jgi:hypothetical protein